MNKIIIAIDGFSSCGKSTMAKTLAAQIGYIYIDSGAMYRAVTLYAIEHHIIINGKIDQEKLASEISNIKITFRYNDTTHRPDTYLNGVNVEERIRSMEISSLVSPISAIPFVRHAMVTQQQTMGKERGIVMDGRDIGTTVFPNADLKIFVTATAQTRAQRRVDELTAKGTSVSYEEVLKNVEERDYIDQNRAESPLRRAEDALILDNSHLTIAQQNEWLITQYNRVIDQQQ